MINLGCDSHLFAASFFSPLFVPGHSGSGAAAVSVLFPLLRSHQDVVNHAKHSKCPLCSSFGGHRLEQAVSLVFSLGVNQDVPLIYSPRCLVCGLSPQIIGWGFSLGQQKIDLKYTLWTWNVFRRWPIGYNLSEAWTYSGEMHWKIANPTFRGPLAFNWAVSQSFECRFAGLIWRWSRNTIHFHYIKSHCPITIIQSSIVCVFLSVSSLSPLS